MRPTQLRGDSNDDVGDSATRGQGSLIGWLRSYFEISGDSSEGRFSIIEHPIDPGRMVHPHVHAREDEFSYVLEGEIGARIGDDVVQATAAMFSSRGAYRTLSGMRPLKSARLLELISPAGFEQYFAELADLLRTGGGVDQITNLAARYGMELRMDWVPELCTKFNLKLVSE